MKKPFFSIVIPTYNRAEDLQFALFCIFQQTFRNFEVIISDNYSTDSTQEVVGKLKDKRIRYSRTKTNLGNALNMGRGLKYAKGKYIFYHSDDDFLPYSDSLKNIYKKIQKYKPGFVRLNYVSLSIDKKRIFSYKVNKSFVKDTYISKGLGNKKIVSFIREADPYFITGIIFKNSLPHHVKIIDSDPAPWFEILFFTIKKYGACFLIQQDIIARWSRRKINKNVKHHIFTLINGKLRSENYLDAVKKKLSRREYKTFIHKELILLYVALFHAIKFNVGNKKMIQMAKQISFLDPTMKKSMIYWVYLISALFLPRIFLKFIRDTYLYLYTLTAKVDNQQEKIKKLQALELHYLHSKENVMKITNPIFNFK